MIVNIDINIKKMVFILTGDISFLINNKRLWVYLEEYLAGNIIDNSVHIPYESDNIEIILQAIIKLVQNNGRNFKASPKVTTLMMDFFREENNFITFSQKAREIRNNELDQNHIKKFSEFTNILANNLPSRRLYPLQLLSAYHLAFSQNACNFSVPGSGKTSIVYGAFAYLRSLPVEDTKRIDKLVIIGPLSSFGPWEDEYFECFGIKPDVKRISGNISKAFRTKHFYSSHPSELTLTSYYSVPRDLDDLTFFLNKYKTMLVLDEAHKIKNVEGGLIATSVLSLAKYCRSRVVLTGTPAPNGYEDINNLFHFIWPMKKIIPFNTFQLMDMSENFGDSRVQTLVHAVSPYFIRIKKSDLLIPDPIEHKPIILKMGNIQREIYDFIEKKYMDFFLGQKSISAAGLDILTRARLIRLMQASTNPSLLKKPLDVYFEEQGIPEGVFIDDSLIIKKIMDYYQYEKPPKFLAAENLIKKILNENGKVVVWAIFIQNILDFSAYLLEKGIENKVLYGATPIDSDGTDEDLDTREKIIREFHDPDCMFKVIVANPFAISESISLHKVCHHAIYLERSFNAAHFIQSKDRIHRYGLKPDDQTNYYYILSDNNTDKTIHERLIIKEKRMMEIIENEPIPLFRRLEDDEADDINILIKNYVSQKI